MILSLQSLPYEGVNGGYYDSAYGEFFLTLIIFALVFAIAIWIYTSFAFMAIARKNKQTSPGIAWIPVIGPAIVAVRASKMPWWPILLLLGIFIPIVGSLAMLAFSVFNIIWNWKMFEALGRPGWWAIFILISPVYLVLIGVAAWSDS